MGRVLTSDELYKASGGAKQFGRRIRELRNEEGWPIPTHNDRSDLKPGEYLLESHPPENPGYQFARKLSTRLRAQVLERNGYTCQMSGLSAGEPNPNRGGAKTKLQVSHIVDKSLGGDDTLSNLKTFCMTCNQGAQNLVQEPPSRIWLLSQLRRANVDDQEAALNWLKNKFREN
jgi:hypothetical protein